MTSAGELARAAEVAHRRSLDHPAKLAAMLDHNWEPRAHSDLISRSLVDLAEGRVRRLLVTTPPQIGKPLDVGTLVLMGDGSRKPLGSVEVGDTVITHAGRPRRVTDVHEQGQQQCVRITTHSGRETVAALDHPFLTPDGWVKAGELREGEVLAAVPRPRVHPDSPITAAEARLMGYIVGDGSTHGNNQGNGSFAAGVTTASDAIDDRIRACCGALGFHVYDSRASNWARKNVRYLSLSGGVRPWMVAHGLARKNSYTKRVPAAVFRSSPEVIAEFIAGYWDCDGVVSSRGKGRDGAPRRDVHCELYSVSRELLGDVQHLLLRLGMRATIRTKKGAYNDAEHISYRLQLIARDDVAKFRGLIDLAHEKRAAALQRHTMPRTDFDQALMADAVTRVEPVGDRECRCLTVDEDHTFTADDLVVHNSVLLSEWFPFWWLIRNPQHRIVVGSYGTSLANRRGRVVRKLVREHGWRYGLEMEPGAASVAEWSLTSGGGLKSVGVGSGVTGSPADCIAGGTLMLTEHGEIPAARLARMHYPPRVAAWNHQRVRFEWRKLRAVRALRLHTLREIETEGRRSLWCSNDHPVYVLGRGYIQARHVNAGDEVIAATEATAPLQRRSFDPFPPTGARAPAQAGQGAPRGRAAAGGPGQSTRPAFTAPAGQGNEPAVPERRRDWVRINRVLPSRSTKTVYDFQVEGLGNFIADGILTHNCAIIDDPHKSRAEAESLVTRDKVWDWWSADITSRLAPGAPVVLVQTRWHCDDLSARAIEQDGLEEDGGLWRVIRLPALADDTNDPLGRDYGQPLPHPKIAEGDHATAREHWEMKRSTSTVRDWHALYQADPQPNEGALVSPELLRARRFIPPPVGVQRYGVAVDPAGGGRDLAGVIGGYLGTDSRLYITHDRSKNGHSSVWAMAAALLCAENGADFIIFEQSGIMGLEEARTIFDSAWDAVQRMHRGDVGDWDQADDVRRAQALDHVPPKPQIKIRAARKAKLLRAEPVAQQWQDDRMRTGSYLPELESEWTTFQPTDPDSPGRIDASVYLAYEMLPIPGSEAMVAEMSDITRSEVQQRAMRRPAAQPQMAARIQRQPLRPR